MSTNPVIIIAALAILFTLCAVAWGITLIITRGDDVDDASDVVAANSEGDTPVRPPFNPEWPFMTDRRGRPKGGIHLSHNVSRREQHLIDSEHDLFDGVDADDPVHDA